MVIVVGAVDGGQAPAVGAVALELAWIGDRISPADAGECAVAVEIVAEAVTRAARVVAQVGIMGEEERAANGNCW